MGLTRLDYSIFVLPCILLYPAVCVGSERISFKSITRTCKLIPIEIDRLEYLISYCLKNYYIKRANFVADGEYVPKWQFENLKETIIEHGVDMHVKDYERNDGALQNLSVTVNGERYKII